MPQKLANIYANPLTFFYVVLLATLFSLILAPGLHLAMADVVWCCMGGRVIGCKLEGAHDII